jgi:glycosyltransferase involved in cell wall biosynthesis
MTGRILYIAYYYPPLGGPASIRAGKTVKYLKKKGWEIDVLSVKNIVYHSFDCELAEECQPDRIVRTSSAELLSLLFAARMLAGIFKKNNINKPDTEKTRTESSCYFSIPEKFRRLAKKALPIDEKIGWYPFALKAGMKLLKTREYDLIMVSISPYTSALIGKELSQRSKIPLLIDYRDHWTLNPYEDFLTPWHRKLSAAHESKILASARFITSIGKTMSQELQLLAKSSSQSARDFMVIYNGYDESDFPSDTTHTPREEGKLLFTYTGNFYQQRTPRYFCEALRMLKKENNPLAAQLKARFVGNYHSDVTKIISASDLKSTVEIIPQVSHINAISLLMKSDVLLLFIPAADGKGVITSKIFEYLRTNKPILAMIPEACEAAELIRNYSHHIICPPEEPVMITEAIVKASKGLLTPPGDPEYKRQITRFSREEQTNKLDETLKVRLFG